MEDELGCDAMNGFFGKALYETRDASGSLDGMEWIDWIEAGLGEVWHEGRRLHSHHPRSLTHASCLVLVGRREGGIHGYPPSGECFCSLGTSTYRVLFLLLFLFLIFFVDLGDLIYI
jgi:hypothetical protein